MKKNIFISVTIIFLILICIINAQDTEYGYSDDIPPIEIKVNFNSTLSGKEKITNDTTKIYKAGDKVNFYIDIFAIIPDNYSNRTINAYIYMNNINTNDIIYLQGDQLNEFYSPFTYRDYIDSIDYIEKYLNIDNASFENLYDSILSNSNNNVKGLLSNSNNNVKGLSSNLIQLTMTINPLHFLRKKIYKVAIKTSYLHQPKSNKFIFQINPKEESDIDIYILILKNLIYHNLKRQHCSLEKRDSFSFKINF